MWISWGQLHANSDRDGFYLAYASMLKQMQPTTNASQEQIDAAKEVYSLHAPKVDCIGKVKPHSTQDCLHACESRSDCRAFADVTKNKRCGLKSVFGEAVAAPPIVSSCRLQ